jgi:hypothetical protein
MPTATIPAEDRAAAVMAESRDSEIGVEVRVTEIAEVRTALVTR